MKYNVHATQIKGKTTVVAAFSAMLGFPIFRFFQLALTFVNRIRQMTLSKDDVLVLSFPPQATRPEMDTIASYIRKLGVHGGANVQVTNKPRADREYNVLLFRYKVGAQPDEHVTLTFPVAIAENEEQIQHIFHTLKSYPVNADYILTATIIDNNPEPEFVIELTKMLRSELVSKGAKVVIQ